MLTVLVPLLLKEVWQKMEAKLNGLLMGKQPLEPLLLQLRKQNRRFNFSLSFLLFPLFVSIDTKCIQLKPVSVS